MATFSGELRQGLPRVPGGEPWPAGGVTASEVATTVAPSVAAEPEVAAIAPDVRGTAVPAEAKVVDTAEAPPATSETAAQPADPATPVAPSQHERVLRRGLPRVPGGEPWPAEGALPGEAPVMAASPPEVSAPEATAPDPVSTAQAVTDTAAASDSAPAPAEPAAGPAPQVPVASTATEVVRSDVPLRRGLPRVSGGDPWPPEGFAPVTAMGSAPATAAPVPDVSASPEGVAAEPAPADAMPAESIPAAEDAVPVVAETAQPVRSGLPSRGTSAASPVAPSQTTDADEREPVPEPARPAAAPAPAATKPAPTKSATSATPAKPAREPIMIGEKTLAQWVKLGVLGAVAAVVAAAILVLAARGVTTLPGVPEWLERYPGEYALPESAEPGFPWWARWSHFLNIFLMVLIIRSGLLVRTQQKPPAFWTPRKGGKKISINLWLHTSLDVVWVVNGVLFVIMLFVSGHWMRIIPTSWEVFPNALSAMLQYMTLDWPVENGWVNYNSLQQLMYFTIIFIAAPLAIITGVRMSEWWPEKAAKLNKAYPAPLARALHFPTMLFFVLFILVHVFLVFSTGALKNLNHMFAGTEVVNWTGFWLFALAILLTAVGWFAMRPLVLAPIASLFGKVSNR